MSSKMSDRRDVHSTRDTESWWKSLRIYVSVLQSVSMKLSWCGGWEFYENLIMSHTLVDQMNSDWEQKHRWILRKAVLNIRRIYFVLWASVSASSRVRLRPCRNGQPCERNPLVSFSFTKLSANSFVKAVWTLRASLYLKKKHWDGGGEAKMSRLKYWDHLDQTTWIKSRD